MIHFGHDTSRHAGWCTRMHREGPTLAHEMTATRAYRLWQRAGRPEGRDWEFWFGAEEELRSEYGEGR